MVYIIVLNWNGAADTIACAESVLALNDGPFQLVICDNASADDSVATLGRWARSLARDSDSDGRLCGLVVGRSARRHAAAASYGQPVEGRA